MNFSNMLKLFIVIVGLGFASPSFSSSILSSMTDTVNSGIVNTKVSMSDSLSSANIDATVLNGIVIYSGEVRSKAQVDELIRIAHSISGINGVDVSRLRIINK